MHISSLVEARRYIDEVKKQGKTIGSIHTLGALHDGHGTLIRQSAQENDVTIVTVYPNKIQLKEGSVYKYNLERDIEFSLKNGATVVISSTDAEMFPSNYRTYVDQRISESKLALSSVPALAQGTITGCIRWLIFTKPTKSYWGLKDIEQYILVKRAVEDLLIDTEIVPVPCVRYRNGVPISSRLMGLEPGPTEDVALLYMILNKAREKIHSGETSAKAITSFLTDELNSRLKYFTILFTTVADADFFQGINEIRLPFIVQVGLKFEHINHFDGQLVTTSEDLEKGMPVIWLSE